MAHNQGHIREFLMLSFAAGFLIGIPLDFSLCCKLRSSGDLQRKKQPSPIGNWQPIITVERKSTWRAFDVWRSRRTSRTPWRILLYSLTNNVVPTFS